MKSHAAALAVAFAVSACQPATAIVVDITTDVPCGTPPAAHMTTQIAIGTAADVDARPPVATTGHCDVASGHIGSLVIVPSGPEDGEVAVRVVTGVARPAGACDAAGGDGCIVARRVLRFVPHETIDLPVAMTVACEGVPCGAGETCVRSACVTAELNGPSTCPSQTGCGAADGGAGAGAEGVATGPGDAATWSNGPSPATAGAPPGPGSAPVTRDGGKGRRN